VDLGVTMPIVSVVTTKEASEEWVLIMNLERLVKESKIQSLEHIDNMSFLCIKIIVFICIFSIKQSFTHVIIFTID